MLSFFALFLGFTGMLGFWGLAWWLLKQPVAEAEVEVESRPRQSVWRNEATGGRELSPVPPTRALEDVGDESVPNRRIHDDSSSNTLFFNRTDVERRDNPGEGTEIILDALPSTERTAFLTNPFPENASPPPAPSRTATMVPARVVPPPPPPKSGANSRKTWLLGGSGTPDGR